MAIRFDAHMYAPRGERLIARIAQALLRTNLHITEGNIALGRAGDAAYCPVALALKALFPKALDVRVGVMGITLIYKDYTEEWSEVGHSMDGYGVAMAQGTLGWWIYNFDRQTAGLPNTQGITLGPVEPITFQIAPVRRYARRKGIVDWD